MSTGETASVVAAIDPADPYERAAQTFPRLTGEQVACAAAFGAVQDPPMGTVLFERGDRTVDVFLVLAGNIEIYETRPDRAPVVFTVHAEHQFAGELDLFNDRDISAIGEGSIVIASVQQALAEAPQAVADAASAGA